MPEERVECFQQSLDGNSGRTGLDCIQVTTVKTYASEVQADLDRLLLEAAGIEAFLPDENSAVVGYDPVVNALRLQVRDDDAEKALSILEEKVGVPLPGNFIPPAGVPGNIQDQENMPPIRPIILLLLGLIILAFLAYLLRDQYRSFEHLR